MKKGLQRAFAIAIAVLMILSTVALVFPAFSVPQPVPQPVTVSSFETTPAPPSDASGSGEPAAP